MMYIPQYHPRSCLNQIVFHTSNYRCFNWLTSQVELKKLMNLAHCRCLFKYMFVPFISAFVLPTDVNYPHDYTSMFNYSAVYGSFAAKFIGDMIGSTRTRIIGVVIIFFGEFQ
jgi:hypothetical protein